MHAGHGNTADLLPQFVGPCMSGIRWYLGCRDLDMAVWRGCCSGGLHHVGCLLAPRHAEAEDAAIHDVCSLVVSCIPCKVRFAESGTRQILNSAFGRMAGHATRLAGVACKAKMDSMALTQTQAAMLVIWQHISNSLRLLLVYRIRTSSETCL